MTRFVASFGPTAVANPQPAGGSTAQLSEINSEAMAKGALLWTVQEGLANEGIRNGVTSSQDASPEDRHRDSCGRDELRQPGSFSLRGDLGHSYGDHHTSVRGRAMSFDKEMAGLRGDGESWSSLGQPRGSDSGSSAANDGFPTLLRRRTFTEATATQAGDRDRIFCPALGAGGDGRSGRVPMSVSEGNMLALLSKHAHVDRGTIDNNNKTCFVERNGGNRSSSGNGGGGSSSPSCGSSTRSQAAALLKEPRATLRWIGGGGLGDGGGSGGDGRLRAETGAQTRRWDLHSSAMDRARRNTFVIRWAFERVVPDNSYS